MTHANGPGTLNKHVFFFAIDSGWHRLTHTQPVMDVFCASVQFVFVNRQGCVAPATWDILKPLEIDRHEKGSLNFESQPATLWQLAFALGPSFVAQAPVYVAAGHQPRARLGDHERGL
jgi:hypothetical protein